MTLRPGTFLVDREHTVFHLVPPAPSLKRLGHPAMNAGLGEETPRQVFDLDDSIGRYVRFQVNSNYGSSVVQVGEVAGGPANLAGC